MFDNIAAAARVLGIDRVGTVWGVANMDWSSAQERDAFLQSVSRMGVGQ